VRVRLFDKNFLVILGIDALLLAGSWYLAHLLRFNFSIPSDTLVVMFHALPFVLAVKLITFYLFDMYQGMWRYTSIGDLFNVIKGASLGSLLVIVFILFAHGFKGFSRSIHVLDWVLTIIFISGFRLGIRMVFSYAHQRESGGETGLRLLFWKKGQVGGAKRLLIVGAGDCGEKIYREIRDNAHLRYQIVGFVDDDPDKVGKKIHGISVQGTTAELKSIAQGLKADEALIAIPSATSGQMRTLVARCEESGILFKTVPGMGELIDGKVTVNAIRDVAYRDLLGREVIRLEEDRIAGYIRDSRVLVTGAGGSIGSELCRQICRFRPASLVLYERAESPLYDMEMELKADFPHVEVVPLLADIRNMHELERAFDVYRPGAVFHAAAYKHVPMLELQPWKAVNNNILGTRNMIEVSRKYLVEHFVFISTDKAVRPTNVMGASKRVTELLVQAENGCGVSATRFMIVRFGNVVGSEGSVVPLFKKQILRGGPVTVTHPEVTRYFMTIPEACQLVLQAGAMGEGGEVFILEMGTPVKIDQMARDLIRLSGFEPDVDIKIEYIGLRPGEKLYEELITQGEGIIATSHEKIMVLRGQPCDKAKLYKEIKEVARLAQDQDCLRIKKKIKEIVPEYEIQRGESNEPEKTGLSAWGAAG